MAGLVDDLELLKFIVNRVNVGIFTVNKFMQVTLWNKFMEIHCGRRAEEIIGKDLFACFPDLPKMWLKKKIKSVFVLRNFSFTSWEQRPYLFKFQHNRPITGGVEFMYQNCAFLPVKNPQGIVESVCITLFDVTDACISQNELQNAKASLKEMSTKDALTGIFNRGYLEDELIKEFKRIRRYGGELSLVIFDIDFFKKINDSHGHLAGDEVLKSIARQTMQIVRSSDIAGRYGGEEFAIILPGVNINGAFSLGERLRKQIAERPVSFNGGPVSATISVGISEINAITSSHEQLIKEADTALYYSKRHGRNRVTQYSAQLMKEINLSFGKTA